jgi:hypothetical protein
MKRNLLIAIPAVALGWIAIILLLLGHLMVGGVLAIAFALVAVMVGFMRLRFLRKHQGT